MSIDSGKGLLLWKRDGHLIQCDHVSKTLLQKELNLIDDYNNTKINLS